MDDCFTPLNTVISLVLTVIHRKRDSYVQAKHISKMYIKDDFKVYKVQ